MVAESPRSARSATSVSSTVEVPINRDLGSDTSSDVMQENVAEQSPREKRRDSHWILENDDAGSSDSENSFAPVQSNGIPERPMTPNTRMANVMT